MEITWSAVRCVRRSSQRSPLYGSRGPVGEAGLEQFRAQIVMVEYELGTVKRPEAPGRSARRCQAGCTPAARRSGLSGLPSASATRSRRMSRRTRR